MKRYLVAFKRFKEELKDRNLSFVSNVIKMVFFYFIYGSSPRDYLNFEFYKLPHKKRKTFLTMKKTYKVEKKYNLAENAKYFNNKHDFNKIFSDFIQREWLYVPDSDFNKFNEFMIKHQTVLVKPTNSSSGHGIRKINYLKIGNMNEYYNELIKEKVLIEEIVINHDKINEINESSLNTIRVYTLNKNNNIKVIFMAFRVGRNNSAVDNFHSGGIAFPINLTTGKLIVPGRDIKDRKYYEHPDSNFKLKEFMIPYFNEIKEKSIKAATLLEGSNYLGWDFGVTNKGVELIEGNYDSDPGLLQAVDKIGKKEVFYEKI